MYSFILISSAFVCGIIYISIFIYTINEILKIFSRKSFNRNHCLWRSILGSWPLILAIFFGFVAYCGVFIISQFIRDKELAKFITSSNDKIYGLLLAALIAQVLSSLFSRQNYDYQNRLAHNNAKADRIEANVKQLNNSTARLLLERENFISFRVNTQSILNKPATTQESEQDKRAHSEVMRRVLTMNDKYENLQITLEDIQTELSSLGLTPIIPSLVGINTYFFKMINELDTGNPDQFKQRLTTVDIPYRNKIVIVLLTLADAARAGIDIPCPSEKQLDDFVKNSKELSKWYNNVKELCST